MDKKTAEEFIRKAEEFDRNNPGFHVAHPFPRLILPRGMRLIEWHDSGAAYSFGSMRIVCSSTRESDGKQWIHASLSYPNRMPSYEDMKWVKGIFIGASKTAYQIFAAESKHVNVHPYCLHLWHCVDGDVTPDFTRGNGII